MTIAINKEAVTVEDGFKLIVDTTQEPPCFIKTLALGIEESKEKAKLVTDKKDYKLSLVSISNRAFEIITNVFGIKDNFIGINGILITGSYDIADDYCIKYHHSYTTFEMGGNNSGVVKSN